MAQLYNRPLNLTQEQICIELMYNIGARLEDVDYREPNPRSRWVCDSNHSGKRNQQPSMVCPCPKYQA